MSRVLLFGIAFLVIIVMVILLPKHLCAYKKWQCEQYKSTINTMKDITTAIRRFQSDRGYFPKNLNILTKSFGKTPVKYLDKIKTDSWANPFIYIVKEKGEEFFLYSVGINSVNEFGKGDDIVFDSQHNRSIYCD